MCEGRGWLKQKLCFGIESFIFSCLGSIQCKIQMIRRGLLEGALVKKKFTSAYF